MFSQHLVAFHMVSFYNGLRALNIEEFSADEALPGLVLSKFKPKVQMPKGE